MSPRLRSLSVLMILSLVGLLTAHAQTYDLRFVLIQNDSTNGGIFRVSLQIQRGTGSDFAIGSSNFRFGYNSAALIPATPFISEETNFDDALLHPTLGVPTYSDMTSVGTDTAGFASVNVDLLTTGNGFPQISSGTWTDIATVDFVIKDASAFSGLAYRVSAPGNNIVFDQNQQTILTQGVFSDLNQIIGQKKQPPVTLQQSYTICNGESVTVAGNTYSSSGQYSDTVMAPTPNPDTIFVTDLQVDPVPVATLSQWNATLTVSSTLPGSVQWVDCNAGFNPISGADSSFFEPAVNGTYAAVVTSGNCSDTTACVSINSVSIDQRPDGNLIRIWPNPSAGKVRVDFSTGVFDRIWVTDIQGRTIWEAPIHPHQTMKEISGTWPSGWYLIRMKGDRASTNRSWQIQY